MPDRVLKSGIEITETMESLNELDMLFYKYDVSNERYNFILSSGST